jgi:hypothetical protein
MKAALMLTLKARQIEKWLEVFLKGAPNLQSGHGQKERKSFLSIYWQPLSI